MTNILPIETIIRRAGTPNANGKHESLPKHCTDFLSSGVMRTMIKMTLN